MEVFRIASEPRGLSRMGTKVIHKVMVFVREGLRLATQWSLSDEHLSVLEELTRDFCLFSMRHLNVINVKGTRFTKYSFHLTSPGGVRTCNGSIDVDCTVDHRDLRRSCWVVVAKQRQNLRSM